eukprot:GILJ01003972.1.p1 GENE.GILJ01003972.1~~GILJ01003972.1.p1  ORF type:complete len:308 (+),score=23.34 GILJ01003972.1:42-926(+)
MAAQQYNPKSSAVKRILQEVKEMTKNPNTDYWAAPVPDNLFEWHFTIRGPLDTEFAGGLYHGRIVLPSDYPYQPPSIMLLTPNGRFEVRTKICLSISSHHPEFWQPAWSVRTILEALITFMPTEAKGAIGSLEFTKEERKRLALESTNFECPLCGSASNTLHPSTSHQSVTHETVHSERVPDPPSAPLLVDQVGAAAPQSEDTSSGTPTTVHPESISTQDEVAERDIRRRHVVRGEVQADLTAASAASGPSSHRHSGQELRSWQLTLAAVLLLLLLCLVVTRRMYRCGGWNCSR